MLILILVVFMIIGFAVQQRLKSKFKKYGKIGLQNGLSGKEIAEKMLHDNGITDVQVISTPGRLTDHYNPKDKTINLSEDVYHQNSVAAAAVAAHECGHAIQHAQAYSWLEFRSAMVPVVNFSSRAMSILFMLLIFGAGANLMGWGTMMWILVILQGAVTLFTVVTLPVEYDASKRALVWLRNENMTTTQEQDIAKDALNAAANTYLVAALASITQLAYFILMAMGRD